MLDAERRLHDFKNHLAIIRGFAEILIADTPIEDRRRADLEEIFKAAAAALDLLARLDPDSLHPSRHPSPPPIT